MKWFFVSKSMWRGQKGGFRLKRENLKEILSREGAGFDHDLVGEYAAWSDCNLTFHQGRSSESSTSPSSLFLLDSSDTWHMSDILDIIPPTTPLAEQEEKFCTFYRFHLPECPFVMVHDTVSSFRGHEKESDHPLPR